jgi:hypothetical protein
MIYHTDTYFVKHKIKELQITDEKTSKTIQPECSYDYIEISIPSTRSEYQYYTP